MGAGFCFLSRRHLKKSLLSYQAGVDSSWENKDCVPSEGQEEDSEQEEVKEDGVKCTTASYFRWSQIMYMYYLLGYKIMELPISDERKEVRWIEESDQLFRLEQRTPSCLHLTGTSTSSQRRSSDLLTWWRRTRALVPLVEGSIQRAPATCLPIKLLSMLWVIFWSQEHSFDFAPF